MRTRTRDLVRLRSPASDPAMFYERLFELRRTNRMAFDELPPLLKVQLGEHEAAQREHARLEAIRNEPEGASRPQ